MPESPIEFSWYELMTSDDTAAAEFYSAVIGWNTSDSGMTTGPEGSPADFKYTILSAGETGVGGLMKIPGDCPEAQPGWIGYIGVDNTDAYAERVQTAGGKILREPADIPGVGRFAVVADPHGAAFILFTPNGEPPAETPAPTTPGLIGWHELHAGNGPEAFDFYSGLFGWQKSGSMDMGELGVYQMFKASADGADCGAMMTKMPDCPAPFWLFYVNVPSVNETIEKVKANGGQLLTGPHEVPGPMWIAQFFDPQGAIFAVVSPTP